MAILYIDGRRLKNILTASTQWVLANEQVLNDLNIFPVPDGDTGTNMAATLKNIMQSLSSNENELIDDVSSVANKTASAALMGARGNSGVILSQFFKGFSMGASEMQRLDACGTIKALEQAYKQAYEAISNPTEGTILTVIRESVQAVRDICKEEKDIGKIMEVLLKEAKKSLMNTPHLLPVLKEAGVVDSGALGYVYIIEGINMYIKGESLPAIDLGKKDYRATTPKDTQAFSGENFYGYCIEFFIHGDNSKYVTIKNQLSSMGDSIVLAEDENLIKVHIHSKVPGDILNLCQEYGILSNIKIDNMDDQHVHNEELKLEKENVIIGVVNGKGFFDIYKSLGCDECILCQETMNPSVQEINSAIHKFKAKNYFILPNNSNVFLSAQQAKELNPHKNIQVLSSVNILQGIAALLAYDADKEPAANTKLLTEAIENLYSGEVIKATKNRSFDGIEIKENEFFGLRGKKVLGTFSSVKEAVFNMIDSLLGDEEDAEIITVYYSKEVTEEETRSLSEQLELKYKDYELDIQSGGHPYYSLILSVE